MGYDTKFGYFAYLQLVLSVLQCNHSKDNDRKQRQHIANRIRGNELKHQTYSQRIRGMFTKNSLTTGTKCDILKSQKQTRQTKHHKPKQARGAKQNNTKRLKPEGGQ